MIASVSGLIGGGRSLRVCDLCGSVDDHPRHAIIGGPDQFEPIPDAIALAVMNDPNFLAADEPDKLRLVRELFDRAVQDRHMDCCREAGCPTGACDAQTAGATDARGEQLLDHLGTIEPAVSS